MMVISGKLKVIINEEIIEIEQFSQLTIKGGDYAMCNIFDGETTVFFLRELKKLTASDGSQVPGNVAET